MGTEQNGNLLFEKLSNLILAILTSFVLAIGTLFYQNQITMTESKGEVASLKADLADLKTSQRDEQKAFGEILRGFDLRLRQLEIGKKT
jgi:hypothetical protein